MLTDHNPLVVAGTTAIFAASGAFLSIMSNHTDWKIVSFWASMGCVLGLSYLDSGEFAFTRLLNYFNSV